MPIECHKRGAKLGKASLFLLNSERASSLLSGFLKLRICCTIFSSSLFSNSLF